MKKILSAILALTMVIALGACGPAKNNDNLSDADYITQKGEMIVGITLFAPMNYMENNELVGFETEFTKAVCEKLGVTPKFEEIDWATKEIELSAKNIDCIWNGLTIDDTRKETMSITAPYMNNRQVMVVRKENLSKYANNVKGAKVVAESGSTGDKVVTTDEFFKTTKYTEVDSQAKALLDVAAGTSDIAVIDYVAAIGSIGENTDYKNLVINESGKTLAGDEYGVAFRKGSDMTAKVNEAMKEVVKDGTLAKIAAKYAVSELITIEAE